MENGPFIDDFPIKTSIYEGFSIVTLNYQRVHQQSTAPGASGRQCAAGCWFRAQGPVSARSQGGGNSPSGDPKRG